MKIIIIAILLLMSARPVPVHTILIGGPGPMMQCLGCPVPVSIWMWEQSV
jgi:hypothetical protein